MTDPGITPGTRVIAILGMHRSGTSCLTGSLQQAGLALGEVHTWNRYNLRGNREKQGIVDLNDQVLESCGGSWDDPAHRCDWSEAQLAQARELVRGLPGAPVQGFKDPRTLLTIDGWLRAVPQLEFVGVFRNPRAVAGSLARRSGMPAEQALRLWYHYNRILLALQRRHRFPLLDFDVGEAQYIEDVARVATGLGLDGEAARAAPFFDEDLRVAQTQPLDVALPYRVKLLHWRLRRRVGQ